MKVKVKELNAGNLVYVDTENGKRIGTVTYVAQNGYLSVNVEGKDYGGNPMHGKYKNISPITITEGFLIRNRFVREGDIGKETYRKKTKFGNKPAFLTANVDAYCTQFRLYDHDNVLTARFMVKYIHQLQNLLTIYGINMELRYEKDRTNRKTRTDR